MLWETFGPWLVGSLTVVAAWLAIRYSGDRG